MYSVELPQIQSVSFQKFNLKKLLTKIKKWQRNIHTRQQLAMLPAERLKDIGLTIEQQQREVNKPFWED